MDALVCELFRSGYSQLEIRVKLNSEGFPISERHLKRKLKTMRLTRHNVEHIPAAIEFIKEELQSNGSLNGYRMMHSKCLNKGIFVNRETVRLILIELDPTGVQFRKKNAFDVESTFPEGLILYGIWMATIN
jgi:hypothetical protein